MAALIAPFVQKAYQLASDAEFIAVASWNDEGTHLVVWDAHEFERTVLPKHFKHNNFSSFVRQLNTYGFHKVSNSTTNGQEFFHPHFLRDVPGELANIKRRRKGEGNRRALPSTTSPGDNLNIPSQEDTSQYAMIASPCLPAVEAHTTPFQSSTEMPDTTISVRTAIPLLPTANMALGQPHHSSDGPVPSPTMGNAVLQRQRLSEMCEKHYDTLRRISQLQNEWHSHQRRTNDLLRSIPVDSTVYTKRTVPYSELIYEAPSLREQVPIYPSI